jgi:hypothetical protein
MTRDMRTILFTHGSDIFRGSDDVVIDRSGLDRSGRYDHTV